MNLGQRATWLFPLMRLQVGRCLLNQVIARAALAVAVILVAPVSLSAIILHSGGGEPWA